MKYSNMCSLQTCRGSHATRASLTRFILISFFAFSVIETLKNQKQFLVLKWPKGLDKNLLVQTGDPLTTVARSLEENGVERENEIIGRMHFLPHRNFGIYGIGVNLSTGSYLLVHRPGTTCQTM